jgi:hypothetical protein
MKIILLSFAFICFHLLSFAFISLLLFTLRPAASAASGVVPGLSPDGGGGFI